MGLPGRAQTQPSPGLLHVGHACIGDANSPKRRFRFAKKRTACACQVVRSPASLAPPNAPGELCSQRPILNYLPTVA